MLASRSNRACKKLADGSDYVSGRCDPATLGARLACSSRDPDEAETLSLLCASIDKLSRLIDSAAIDHEGHIPEAVIDAARRAGLFALSIPETHEGLGLSLKATCSVIDELARIDRSVAVMIGLHAGLGSAGLVRYGTVAQRARYLPSLARGERIAAFAATEPSAGSDLMSIETSGLLAPGGLVVRGHKSYVTNGGFAGLYTLLVRTPDLGGARAQSLLCISRGAEGLRVGAEEDKLGIRGSSTVALDLDDVFVRQDDILGEPGRGSDCAHHVLAWGRTLMAAGCLGIAHAACDLTLAHVTARRQFGRTLASFPLVKADCADMAARTYAMESLVRMAACAEREERRLAHWSTLAKVFCSDTSFQVVDRAIQLHGALGFLEPTGLPRLLRDCRITRIFEGANDVLSIRVGAMLLALPRERVEPNFVERFDPSLRSLARTWHAAFERRNAILTALDTRHGLSMMRRQAQLWALGQAEVQLGAALAALLRAGAETGAQPLALATHAITLLIGEAERSLARAGDEATQDGAARASELAELLFAPLSGRAARDRRREPRAPSDRARPKARSEEGPA